jgi:hypothetical protein
MKVTTHLLLVPRLLIRKDNYVFVTDLYENMYLRTKRSGKSMDLRKNNS